MESREISKPAYMGLVETLMIEFRDGFFYNPEFGGDPG
jgi:hypothetical protein